MSLNDFEYIDFDPLKEEEEESSIFSTFEEGDIEVLEVSIAKAILKKQEAYKAIDALIDASGESWFELGEKLAEKRFRDTLDKLENTLLDSEEDALMTIHLIRKMVEEDERE
jgi:hypothetical protein